MLCGAGNFSYVDDDLPRSLLASPRKCYWRKPDKNPYSARGLDKFSAVLAELEAKRERIMKQVGTRGATSVRFMYTDSNWVPIIVKHLPQDGEEIKKQHKKGKGSRRQEGVERKPSNKKSSRGPPSRQASGSSVEVEEEVEKEVEAMVVAPEHGKRTPSVRDKGGCRRGTRGKLRWPPQWPTYNWLFVMVLILVCLALFGRTFAICCTSIWWYVVPAAVGTGRTGGDRITTTRKRIPAGRVHGERSKSGATRTY